MTTFKTLKQRFQAINNIMEKLEADGLIANENTREMLIEEADEQYLENINAGLTCDLDNMIRERDERIELTKGN